MKEPFITMERIEIIKSFYESNMNKGLPDYTILGWENEEAQRLRFEILASSVNLKGKSILDVGCGTGSLLEYLILKGIEVSYTGVDILESMIEVAINKFPDGNFICTDIFKQNYFKKKSFDVVFSSGIFNLNLGNNEEFLIKALKIFLNLSKEAAVFNLLHQKSPDKEHKFYYYSPDDIIKAIEKIQTYSIKINIIENYLNNDFTVICIHSKIVPCLTRQCRSKYTHGVVN